MMLRLGDCMMKKVFNYLKKIINNEYLFSVFAKVAGLFIAIVVSVLTARFFGTELKGVASVVQNDVTLYSVFLGLGVYQAYPFFRKQNPDVFPVYLNNISSLFLIYETVAVIIATFMFINNINTYLAIAIIIIPVAVYIKQLNYIVLIENPKRRNMNSLLISSSEIFVIGGLWLFWEANVVTAIGYYCVIELFNLTLSFINLRINPLTIRFDITQICKYIKFGFVPMLVYLCMTVNYSVDIQMLKLFKTVSYSDIGIYSTGVSLASKIWLIPDAIKDILLSKLVKGKKEDEVARVLRINLAVCALSIVLLLIFGKPIVSILYGKQFENSYYVMILMLVGIIGMIFYKMVYSYNISQGKRVINLIFLGTAAVVNIMGNLFFIPLLGIWGAGIISVLSYSICGMCFLIYFHKVSKIPYHKLVIIQPEDFKAIKSFIKGSK